MSEPFDPYLKWLGIPTSERPINFYRLLGLSHYEEDPDVISHAADQRVGHIRTFLSSEHAKIAERTVKEIEMARACLLNPDKKAEYDRKLQRMAQRTATPQQPAIPDAVSFATGDAGYEVPATAAPDRRKMLVGLGIAGGVALLVVLLAVLLFPKEGPGVAQNDPRSTDVKDSDSSAPIDAPQPPATSDPAPGIPPVTDDPAPREPVADNPPPEEPSPEGPQPTEPTPEATGPTSEPSDPGDPLPEVQKPEPADPVDPLPMGPEEKPAAKPSGGIFRSTKLPVPDQQAQDKAEAQVREVFSLGGNLSDARLLELSDELLRSGLETRDDPAARFVLLRIAGELAAKAGNIEKTNKIVDEVAKLYETQLLDLKALALDASAKTAGSGPRAVTANMFLVRSAETLIEEAIDNDDYKTASKALEDVALPAARRAGDRRLAADITGRRGEIRRLEDKYSAVKEALASLETDPANEEASLAVGIWYCLGKGDWNKGLPYLAKGGESALPDAAGRDLAGPANTDQQVAVGDAWWAISEETDRSEEEGKRLRGRAAFWYQKALPALSGLMKIKVERRIEESGEVAGEWVLRFDGEKSFVLIPNAMYDGSYPITLEAFATPASIDQTMTVLGNFPRDTTSDAQHSGMRLGMYDRYWDFEMYVKPRAAFMRPRICYTKATTYSTIGQRMHLAGVYDGRSMKLFVDGKLVESEDDAGVHKPSPFPFLVGADPVKATAQGPPTTQKHFDGVIESVRVSNVARYTQEAFVPPKSLKLDRDTLLLLEFNQGKGDEVPNAVSPKQKAKIIDAEWIEKQKWLKTLKELAPPEEPGFGRRPGGFEGPNRPDPGAFE